VLHFGPLDAGLAFLPMSLTILAWAMQAGRLVGRFGAGPVLGCGLTLMAIGMALFGRISVGGEYVSDFMLPSLLVSTGIGLSIVPSTIAATATATPGDAGLASGLVNTSRQMGGALGLAILTSLAVLYTNHLTNVDYRAPLLALDDGFRLAFLLGAGLAAVGALVAFRFLPRSVRPPGHPLAPAANTADAGRAEPPGQPALVSLPDASTVAASPSGDRPDVRVTGTADRTVVRRKPARSGGAPASVSKVPARLNSRGRRPPPKPVARVVLSIAEGRRWPLAAGSMTVPTGPDEGAGRGG
jgi:MFS family permease